MATVKIETVAGGNTYTVSKTVTAAHLVRFIAAQRVLLNMTGSETDEQVHTAWAQKVFDQGKADVKAVERQSASDTAVASVTEIGFT